MLLVVEVVTDTEMEGLVVLEGATLQGELWVAHVLEGGQVMVLLPTQL